MNDKIKELWEQAGGQYFKGDQSKYSEYTIVNLEEFVQRLKEAIYDEVKEELLDEVDIGTEPDIEDRCYLRGCNGGIVDALCIIRNFGVDIDE